MFIYLNKIVSKKRKKRYNQNEAQEFLQLIHYSYGQSRLIKNQC